MAAFRAARKSQEKMMAAAQAACPRLARPSTNTSENTTSFDAADCPWTLEDPGTVVNALTCPKCRQKGMIIRCNGLDNSKFYGCQNFTTFMRCKGTISWSKGQGMMRGVGPAAGSAFRQC